MKRDLAEAGSAQRAEHTIEIPTSMLLTLIERAFEAPTLITMARSSALRSTPNVPPIGAACDGGEYAGLTVCDEQPMLLILLPGEFAGGSHEDAKKWAVEQGGVLPSRHDGLVLFQNMKVKGDFKDAWYWLEPRRAGESDSAWCQTFSDGRQDWGRVSGACRARAVRRLVIQ